VSRADNSVVVRDVVVDFADKVDLPARQTGAITVLLARQNQWIEKGELVAKLDDTQFQIRQRSIQLKESAARLVLQDDVEVR
jgi:multidrug resistance efflux pump